MERDRAVDHEERTLLARFLNPHDFALRGIVLQLLLCTALALLIVDRLAHRLYWPAPGSTQVVLVGSPTCPHSRHAKARLEAAGVDFREIDSRRDALEAALAGWAFQSMSVPIVVVGSEIIHGNRPDRIDAALARRASVLASGDARR